MLKPLVCLISQKKNKQRPTVCQDLSPNYISLKVTEEFHFACQFIING